jgi:hypothetical protein
MPRATLSFPALTPSPPALPPSLPPSPQRAPCSSCASSAAPTAAYAPTPAYAPAATYAAADAILPARGSDRDEDDCSSPARDGCGGVLSAPLLAPAGTSAPLPTAAPPALPRAAPPPAPAARLPPPARRALRAPALSLPLFDLMEATDLPALLHEHRASGLLGKGAEGEVVAVPLGGAMRAVKRTQSSADAEPMSIKSPFVMRPLAQATGSDGSEYFAFPIAAGSLDAAWDALHGLRPDAAADAPRLQAAARPVFAEMVLGVAAVHGAGKRHGDVKPDNFLVAADTGHVSLCDFGLAGQSCQRASGCSRLYASPEVVRDLSGPSAFEARLARLDARLGGCAALRRALDALEDARCGPAAGIDRRGGDVWALGVSFAAMLMPSADAFEDLVARLMAAGRRRQVSLPALLEADEALAGLLRGMLAADERKRLTIDGVKRHAYFAGVDWSDAAAFGAAGRPPLLEALQAAQQEAAAAEPQAAPASQPAQQQQQQQQSGGRHEPQAPVPKRGLLQRGLHRVDKRCREFGKRVSAAAGRVAAPFASCAGARAERGR